MKYAATFYLLTSVPGGDALTFLEAQTFLAEGDCAAIPKAQAIRTALEIMENAEPNPHKVTRQVILQGIRNRYNKRTVCLRGYAH